VLGRKHGNLLSDKRIISFGGNPLLEHLTSSLPEESSSSFDHTIRLLCEAHLRFVVLLQLERKRKRYVILRGDDADTVFVQCLGDWCESH
jgi:hypothetical protein